MDDENHPDVRILMKMIELSLHRDWDLADPLTKADVYLDMERDFAFIRAQRYQGNWHTVYKCHENVD